MGFVVGDAPLLGSSTSALCEVAPTAAYAMILLRECRCSWRGARWSEGATRGTQRRTRERTLE